VKSRRGGPVKAPLSREVIVEEAFRQLTAEGLKGMSLRKVAAALETGPASLYAYVNDLRELQTLVLDRALANVKLPQPGRPWRERLAQLLYAEVEVLCASPGLAQLAFGAIATGPNALRIAETLLGILDDGGVAPATAAWAIDLLQLYVTAGAAEKADSAHHSNVVDGVEQMFSLTSSEEFPHIYAAESEMLSGTGAERFAWAINVLMDGILQHPRTPEQRSQKATKKASATKPPKASARSGGR
jgi:AcrR family transcriptional regulator